jgi:hypothetical protein
LESLYVWRLGIHSLTLSMAFDFRVDDLRDADKSVAIRQQHQKRKTRFHCLVSDNALSVAIRRDEGFNAFYDALGRSAPRLWAICASPLPRCRPGLGAGRPAV